MIAKASLVTGKVYTNNDIVDAFKCSPQGGMRKSNTTNTLVIFALHHKSLYDDKWVDDVLHYTGMGQVGDQDINFGQNKTLALSNVNGIEVHLFESYMEKEYIYDGVVELADDPYYAIEPDVNFNLRKVIKFPIRLKNAAGKKVVPTDEMLSDSKKSINKIIKTIPDAKLKAAAKNAGSESPKANSTNSITYDRDELVKEETKRRAKGVCDLCENPAPFNNKDNEPYLECHHVNRLADGGPDKTYNTVALCPNCHRKIHVLNLKADRVKLIKRIGVYINADGDQDELEKYKALFDLK